MIQTQLVPQRSGYDDPAYLRRNYDGQQIHILRASAAVGCLALAQQLEGRTHEPDDHNLGILAIGQILEEPAISTIAKELGIHERHILYGAPDYRQVWCSDARTALVLEDYEPHLLLPQFHVLEQSSEVSIVVRGRPDAEFLTDDEMITVECKSCDQRSFDTYLQRPRLQHIWQLAVSAPAKQKGMLVYVARDSGAVAAIEFSADELDSARRQLFERLCRISELVDRCSSPWPHCGCGLPRWTDPTAVLSNDAAALAAQYLDVGEEIARLEEHRQALRARIEASIPEGAGRWRDITGSVEVSRQVYEEQRVRLLKPEACPPDAVNVTMVPRTRLVVRRTGGSNGAS